MSYITDNEAYDLSLFEEDKAEEVEIRVKAQKPKKNNVIKLHSDKEQGKRAKLHISPLTAFFSVMVTAFVVLSLVAIIHGQAQLTELNREITNAQDELTELESYYTQMEMKVEAKLSPSVVEEYASDELGMSKTETSQKEFISLSDGDKAVVVTEEEKGLWETILDALKSVWSDDSATK